MLIFVNLQLNIFFPIKTVLLKMFCFFLIVRLGKLCEREKEAAG